MFQGLGRGVFFAVALFSSHSALCSAAECSFHDTAESWQHWRTATLQAELALDQIGDVEREAERATTIRDRLVKARGAVRDVDIHEAMVLVEEFNFLLEAAKASHEAAMAEAAMWSRLSQCPIQSEDIRREVLENTLRYWEAKLRFTHAEIEKGRVRSAFEKKHYDNLKKLADLGSTSARSALEAYYRYRRAEDWISQHEAQEKVIAETILLAKERIKTL